MTQSFSIVFGILYAIVSLFWIFLIARIVIETVKSFARDWMPRGATVVVLEAVMSITDPPVKALRRVIPPVGFGAVRFDLALLVLILATIILQAIFGSLAM